MDKTIFQPTARDRFRLIGILEGISYLLLLGIAMPLKYIWDMPLAVKYVGWAHGVLFIAYLIALLIATLKYRWAFWKMLLGGIASLLPFGPFVLDSRVKNW
jgi:integral membrane protein